jgi:hypothetical protein
MRGSRFSPSDPEFVDESPQTAFQNWNMKFYQDVPVHLDGGADDAARDLIEGSALGVSALNLTFFKLAEGGGDFVAGIFFVVSVDFEEKRRLLRR